MCHFVNISIFVVGIIDFTKNLDVNYLQEVTYRKVLEDHGHRQLVEVEHTAIWRFLCFSGTLLVRVIVDQNRQTHKVRCLGFGFQTIDVLTLREKEIDIPTDY
mgnify:CR=1 FL=1